MGRKTKTPKPMTGGDLPTHKYFSPIDLVEDRMRTRLVGVCALFIIYLFVGSAFITEIPEKPYILTESVTFASNLQRYSTLGPNLITSDAPAVACGVKDTEGNNFIYKRCPALGLHICDDNGNAERPVNVTVTVREISYPLVPRNTLDCSNGPTAFRTRQRDTMPELMIRDACTPTLVGYHEHTDDTGTATFDELAVTSGPAAAYTLNFDGGDKISTNAVTILASRVVTLYPLSGVGADGEFVTPGVPFPRQPEVYVADGNDKPVANATVIAFASEHLHFFQEWVPESEKLSRSQGTERHHVRGQNYHLLTGVRSTVTGADGKATWENLTVTASSSRFLYIMFYCEGAVASWNDPEMRAVVPGQLARPPRYSSPIFIRSPVRHIFLMDPFSNTSLDHYTGCPGNASVPVIQVNDGDKITTARGIYDAGLRLAAPRVRVLDANQQPISGVEMVAIIAEYSSLRSPSLERPQQWRLQDPDYGGLTFPEMKYLKHAVSTPTDAEGVGSWPNLTFSVDGENDGILFKYHRIAFCTPGSTASGIYDGCVLSCPIQVRSRAQSIEWSVQPTYIRAQYAEMGNTVLPGEPFLEAPIKPIVRFTDSNGMGVPSLKPTPYIMDLDVVKQLCLATAGVTLTDEVLLDTGHFITLLVKYRCIADSILSHANLMKLDVVPQAGSTGLSGASGFSIMAVTYQVADPRYMYAPEASIRMLYGDYLGTEFNITGDAFLRASQGRIRLVVADSQISIWSPPSAAFTFSVPSGLFTTGSTAAALTAASAVDTAINTGSSSQSAGAGACATLKPYDFISQQLLDGSVFGTAPTRRPDPYGGRTVRESAFLNSNSTRLQLGDTWSWMFPLEFPLVSTKENVANFLDQVAATAPHLMPHVNFTSLPDYHDVPGNAATFLARIRQAVLNDNACDDPSTAGVTCATPDGVCNSPIECRTAQYADNFGQQLLFEDKKLADPTNSSYLASIEHLRPEFQAETHGIRLQALDATGKGVPGLRVRMNVLDVVFPYLPSVASVVTCGLVVNATDLPTLQIEGLKPGEVADMWSATPFQEACVTDANGVVEMRVTHPFYEGLKVPEIIADAHSGGFQYEYAAYLPNSNSGEAYSVTSLTRACAKPELHKIQSRVEKVEWGYNPVTGLGPESDPRLMDPVAQQRTVFDLIQPGGAIEEVSPNRVDTEGADSTWNYGSYDVLVSVNTDTAANFDNNVFCFRAADANNEGVANKLLSFDLVHLPSYFPGWNTELSPACFSHKQCDIDLAPDGRPIEELGSSYIRIQEYGWNPSAENFWRILQHPFEPYATFMTILTGTWNEQEPGVGCFSAVIHSGHPGVYGVVMAVDGIRSSPLLFNVKSQLASIEMVTEPGNVSESSGVADVVWRVKSVLDLPPVVRLLDTAGARLPRYQVFAEAVDPDTHAVLTNVLFDMSDGVGTTLQGIFNPLGTARSTPANDNGLAFFPFLNLFDAKNGTRFRLKIYFRVTASYENSMLNAFGATDPPEISVITNAVMVAINHHKFTAVQQPSTAVSLGSVLPQTPEVYWSVEMEPIQWTDPNTSLTHKLYKLPSALLSGTITAQIVPAQISGVTLDEVAQIKFSHYFGGSRCSYFFGRIAGDCTIYANYGSETGEPLPAEFEWAQSGYVVGGVAIAAASNEVYADDWRVCGLDDWRVCWNVSTGVFAEATDGVPPMWVTTLDFHAFSWRKGQDTVVPGAALEYPGTLSQDVRFSQMKIESEPATIELLNNVPATVHVGSSFVLLARVTISSGSPLGSALVTAKVVPAHGVVLSPAEYILNAFNIQESMLGPDQPSLNTITNSGVTRADGVVRLILEFVAGTEGDAVAIQVEASNGVKSPRSRPITILTPLNNVTVTENITGQGDYNRDLDFTGTKGVGNRGLIGNKLEGIKGFTEFPINIPLDDIYIPLGLDDFATPLRPGDFPQETFYFRVFTLAGIRRIQERDRQVANFTSATTTQTAALQSTAASMQGSNVTQAEQQLQLVADQLAGSLSDADSQDLLNQFIGILVSGSGPQEGGATSVNAFVYRNFTVGINGPSELVISNVVVEIGKPGEYYLQPVSGGIAGPTLGPIKAGTYNTKTPEAIALDYALKIATTIIISAAAIGNSDWHDPRYGIPVGLCMMLGFLLLSIYTYPIQTVDSIGLWYVITLSIMMAGTGWTLIGLLLGKRVPFTRSFAEVRKENMFAYCKRLVAADVSEASQLMSQLRDQSRVDMPTRLYLEKRLQLVLESERSWKVQMMEIARSCIKGDTAAFYFPTRIYATLTVSLFATSFMAKNIVRALGKLAAGVRAADVATISAIRNSITVLQNQFLEIAEADLPRAGSDWALANVEVLHKHMVSLADSVDVASTAAVTLGLLFYLWGWFTMMLDFRAKVLQARRGIWSFKTSGSKVKFSLTYFGMQISNGLMTFILITFICFPIVLILAWSLTWEVIRYIITQQYHWLLALILPLLFNIIVKKVVTMFIGPGQVITRRFSWHIYDIYELLLNCVTGIIKALVRFALVMAATLFSLPRMDVSIFPAWLDFYIQLDTGARAYHALIFSYHNHNNPIMRVFCWTLQEDAAARARAVREGDTSFCTAKYRRVSNMFHKLLAIHRTRKLLGYNASGASVPAEAVRKAAQKKDIQILLDELKEAAEGDGKGKKGKKGEEEGGEKPGVLAKLKSTFSKRTTVEETEMAGKRPAMISPIRSLISPAAAVSSSRRSSL